MKKQLTPIVLAFIASLGLSACNNDNKSTSTDSSNLSNEYVREYESPEPALDQDFNYIKYVVKDEPFKGILSPVHYQDNPDWKIIENMVSSLFWNDADFEIIDGGLANMSVDKDKNTIHITLREGLKWSDGEPLTVDDIIFTYKVIGHKDYNGPRYDDLISAVQGMKDYHSGKATEISGLHKISDTELEVVVDELSPTVSYGDHVSPVIIPEHYLKDVPVSKMGEDPKTRVHPLSYGPYVLTNMVPGESYELEPNPYYWDQRVKDRVKKLIIKAQPTATTLAAIKNGSADSYDSVPQDLYHEYSTLSNTVVLSRPELYYGYIGFNLGHFDKEKNINVFEPDRKTADIHLRQAMVYALNIEEVCKAYYEGLRTRANGTVPPVFQKYYDPDIGHMPYDPEKAKALLDEAGYKDIDGDGIREDKNGKPFELKMAFMDGGEVAEPLAQYYIQNFKDVGLKVTLTGGRLMDFNTFYEKVQDNDPEIDVFFGAWGTGSSPSPVGLFGKTDEWNFPRIWDETSEQLIQELNSSKYIGDPIGRAEAYKKWHKYYLENLLGYAPIMFRKETQIYNSRLKKVNNYYNSDITPYPTEFTSPKPIMAK